jgi:hypothetical protein
VSRVRGGKRLGGVGECFASAAEHAESVGVGVGVGVIMRNGRLSI